MSGGSIVVDQHGPTVQASLSGDGSAFESKKHKETHSVVSYAETPHSPSQSEASHSNEHGPLERIPTARDELPDTVQAERTATDAGGGPIHSVFTKNQKLFIVFMASWAGFFSPVSGQIYFPALNALASDLHVSNSLINLTLTSYMIFQGLAPTFVGDLADAAGRRPAYAVCFTIYILANIGLALQNSYAALFVLRCFQSSGSSATIAMCSAVVSDVATAAERGRYMGFTLAGSLLGPAIGPVVGGVLAQFLGWRAIFWFLMIMGSAFMVVFAIFFPETARTQVGNGSIPPKGWNMSLMNYLAVRKARKLHPQDQMSSKTDRPQTETRPKKKFRFPNPLRSLHIIMDKENALLLFYNAFLFAAFYDVTATLPSQLHAIFGFNELQIGLCFIPFGCGSLCAALTNGQLLDRNFARWCKKLGVKIRKGRNQDLSNFPIEKVRLQIAIPAAYLTSMFVLAFGWILHANGPLPALLVVLFFTSYSMSIAFNVTSTLLVDFYPKAPATATAANNLVRCGLGAGATAAVIPMIDAWGRGWTFTFLTLGLVTTSPMLWAVYFWGMKWRTERNQRETRARQLKEEKLNQESSGENGRVAEDNDKPPVEGGMVEMAAVAEKDHEEAFKDTSKVRSDEDKDQDQDLDEVTSREEQDVTLSRSFSYESGY
ncbi:uncharacterized protein Z520_02090 [Fonsecaea multimorphosa CBS 102226]|uniref:Major facilitator superfamily (MFS) profile domain-containing protein n=1 Tax=Fonsecaea multimorphosa CBS 102226 TaxID=1442371 RepID=A0A0D2IY53_9EURO|nr:uncharacterized protein Z520_02090 [Fonsecaea multimorphosa CBS 102226]KIY01952.1 hypothetical protein Z520_02090 [Fonsecaea multimorphosa CBS 102226]OAL29634.1 hypothetical protein AYO22_02048 [Fonsecaea multimorphosa]